MMVALVEGPAAAAAALAHLQCSGTLAVLHALDDAALRESGGGEVQLVQEVPWAGAPDVRGAHLPQVCGCAGPGRLLQGQAPDAPGCHAPPLRCLRPAAQQRHLSSPARPAQGLWGTLQPLPAATADQEGRLVLVAWEVNVEGGCVPFMLLGRAAQCLLDISRAPARPDARALQVRGPAGRLRKA
jgi:hypothetical protein